MSARLLLVEDEPAIAEVLADMLRAEGHEVTLVGDGPAGLRMATSGGFDMLILDVMLPGGISGFDICHAAREHGFDGGIIMLTARGLVDDRIRGLRQGADDYLVKPFDPDELLARMDALMRRLRKVELTPLMSMRFGKVTADFAKGEFLRDGQPIALTSKEAELLRMLVNQRGKTVSRDTILAQVWKDQPYITPRTVDVHMAWLRQKVEDQPQTPKHLLTVRGEGYRFEA
ncbi:response regulator transcription factor [Haloferula sp. BvORR071]|uniref:response regulator transcription factor n=1 Tax=Haloferula sp. BvORR071 TaxID=1396141 RepID=UPI00055725C0|nr:response regulator transcription factor [Haloferula sp. BvORR071]